MSVPSPVPTTDKHSGRTRVTPTFTWLRDHGGPEWVTDFLKLADGITAPASVGAFASMHVGRERTVPASPTRLAWLIRNCQPKTPLLRQEFEQRVAAHPKRDATLAMLDAGIAGRVPRDLTLEGRTHCDCLIETTTAFVWVEGKRTDWLSPSVKWDPVRDQLARNLESAWMLATEAGKDWWVVICHEHLRRQEEHLIEGYRRGTWSAGFPHLPVEVRDQFRGKIGTLPWERIFARWPGAGSQTIPPPDPSVC